MGFCDIQDKQHDEHLKSCLDVINYWDSKKNIVKVYDRILQKNENVFAQDSFNTLVEKALNYKPFDENYILPKADFNRIKIEIDNLDKSLTKGINTFSATTFVPRAIVDKFPNMRLFQDNLDKISNYEKNAFATYVGKEANITNHLKKALLNSRGNKAGVKNYGNKTLKKIQKTEGELIAALENGDQESISNYVEQWNKIIESESGEVLNDYFSLMENKKLDHTPDPNVVNAVKESRELLNQMGKVMVSGLTKSVQLAEYIGNSHAINNKIPIKSKEFQNFKKEVEASISNINKAIKKGDYFPHLVLDKMLNVRKDIEKLILTNGSSKDFEIASTNISENLQKLSQEITTMNSIDRAKSRSGDFSVRDLWSKNPIGALKRYSSDVIAFNKLIHMQSEYAKALGNLENVDGRVVESMRDFMNHTFDTATKGYKGRPEWVNKFMKVNSSFEFASKLGFGLTTAARNYVSGIYYLAKTGFKMNDYLHQWDNSTKQGSIDKDILREIESETGFLFIKNDKAITEFVAEGLLPEEGIRQESFKYDLKKGWIYEDPNGAVKKVSDFANNLVNKSSVFQRWTENALREQMFKSAFMMQLEMFNKSPEYVASKSQREIYRKAGLNALNQVNQFAFSYDLYNKSPIIGGTHKNAGALGQYFGNFMHYPMSFANLQAKTFKGAFDAVMAGQGINATEVQMALAFSGIYLSSILATAILNMDVDYWINNDTQQRAETIVRGLHGLYRNRKGELSDDDFNRQISDLTYGRGLKTLIFGSSPDTAQKNMNALIHTAVSMDLIKKPDNELLNFLTDFEEYSNLSNDDRSKYHVQNISNQGYKIAYNWIPAIQYGTPARLFAQEFRLYPTKKSKSLREKIIGKKLTSNEKKLRELADILM